MAKRRALSEEQVNEICKKVKLSSPWDNIKSKIRSVYIDEGITRFWKLLLISLKLTIKFPIPKLLLL